jgi:N-acetylmuramoyl-L-alanine amidase
MGNVVQWLKEKCSLRLLSCRSLVVFMLAVIPSFSWAAGKIESVRIWPSPDTTRVVFDLNEKPKFSVLPSSKNQVLLQLEQISSTSLGKMSGESEWVRDIRVTKVPNKNSIRIQIDLTNPAQSRVFSLPPSDRYGDRLVVDIPHSEVSAPTATVPPPPKPAPNQSGQGRDVIIALDAGHGGHDPGAVGKGGTYEKHVTMAVTQRLAALIDQEPGMRAVLTRTADYYIYPSKRPDLARARQADLLVSIHADAAENRSANGASVWVLSLKRATTEVGRMMERTEQHSELLGGVAEVMKDSNKEPYLAQTVLDLSMNHSMTTGFEVAKTVLAEMATVTRLHRKEPQAASLGVLKAPDIPSILVETGYISNPSEEQRLKSAAHQQKLAKAIFRALKQHFHRNPPSDSWLAKRKGRAPAKNTTRVEVSTAAADTTINSVAGKNSAANSQGAVQPLSNRGTGGLPTSSVPASQLPTQRLPEPVTVKGAKTVGSAVKAPPPVKTPRQHKVKAGDSLSEIAKKYNTSISAIKAANNMKSDTVQIGQTLRIP